MKFPQLKLDNQICHRLYMASNSIVRTYREALTALDLTYPQYVVMMALWEKDKISINELLTKTAIDGGAMTQILKKMTEKKLLHVIKDEHDKRKRVIQLQPAGTQLQLKAESIPAQIRCKFPSISESEATQLISLLDKINNDLTIK
ncbi:MULTISPECIES: MarR family transcriptional regulator [unclassified Pseudoalteromonas]|uniref:MarR family winged helix-turn-helix transcriptional regulator n=1 Tax=unclassified Pseudoalteromonas TaxID=194690 RepID=UPI000B3D20E8|nr:MULTISPECIES: MarR family transcriptional regulator [unclassified Pseudoalteromonas]MDN3380454.1 MarR family transcriptional regulator [Pseudoalteromonas sp. APC 3893]MDN3388836.1 MarR family transcriptional regulator [Pseudoalteromonas sp. APC 4017]OUS70665.1 MarR family transcriptional regulator [Pseudoalteromonas sp. A601]